MLLSGSELSQQKIKEILSNVPSNWVENAGISLRNGRSHNNVTIVLVGLSGAGKSSTVNSLLKQPVVHNIHSGKRSQTKRITEYSVTIDLANMKTQLTVVDTPGLGDTNDETIPIIATLKSYLEQKRKNTHKFWKPNLVLITANITDHRIAGPHSAFTIMLRSLYQICNDFFDEYNSNTLLVLTHFLSLTREKDQEFPHEVVHSYTNVIQNCTELNFVADHVILAENKPESYGLKEDKGNYLLPCNQYYPHNLYTKAQELMHNDPIGSHVLNFAVTYYPKGEKFKVVEGGNWSILGKQEKLVIDIQKIYDVNIRHMAEATPLDNLVEQHWNVLSQELRIAYPDTLISMRSAFKRLGYRVREDIPSDHKKMLVMLKTLKSDDAVQNILESIGVRDFPWLNCEIIAGRSYSIFTDKQPKSSIFKPDNKPGTTCLGFVIPSNMVLYEENMTKNVSNVFTNATEKVNKRMLDLGLSVKSPVSVNIPVQFAGSARAGYNMASQNEYSESEKCYSFSLLREERLFKVEILSTAPLDEDFKKTVQGLGDLDIRDERSLFKYKSMFEKFGTHIIKSAYGGGAIEMEATYKVEQSKSTTINATKITADLQSEMCKAGTTAHFDKKEETRGYNSQTASINSYKLQGGKLGSHKLQKVDEKTMADWIQGLTEKPIMLESEMTLEPIAGYADKVVEGRAFDVDKAFTHLFALEISKITPPAPEPVKRWCIYL